ncbi:type II toxin-antitoxin system RelE/ParE family toxin [Flavivirga aquimarina]|uniref:Type II toxin-antitoxin system RelE/ParE family toxin n=1 Tax=Flavivirga aquimarina TaxID=2027862 RepID=A0ABT8WA61_9FLAO|nr:type II toxin-antitoxin system RelE/ParE family toxin [Flavivirga aquimarina]MDO5970033.1 type II toxin-antitoxin system RelE/ParE family toxin [Flavivirga aquimarina]
MSYTVLVSDEAIFDITEASFWYESQKTGLSKKFQKDIKRGIDYISKQPETLQKRYGNVHIYFTNVFPFGIHYIIDKNTIKVIAVFHTSKDPKNWSKRL